MAKMRVLFSFIGGTDPVRKEHDGPMLHILRHYRPDVVVCLFSTELKAVAEETAWHKHLFVWLDEKWDYRPRVEFKTLEVERVNVLDEVYEPIMKAFEEVRRAYPDAEILVNLSSGTPQMLTVASLLCLENRYGNTVGVQVATHENKMNYTRDDLSDLHKLMETDVDEQTAAVIESKRCSEPKLYALQKEGRRLNLLALLERRDFAALNDFHQEFPEPLSTIVRHLHARYSLEYNKAVDIACELPNDLTKKLNLYPIKSGSNSCTQSRNDDYLRISENYLVLRNLQACGNLNEFIIKLEPFTFELYVALLKVLIPLDYPGVAWEDLLIKNELKIDANKIESLCPDFYKKYKYNLVDKKRIGSHECSLLICSLKSAKSYQQTILYKKTYDKLKKLRNKLAHNLCVIKEEDFEKIEFQKNKKLSSKQLIDEISNVLLEIFPDLCDVKLFTVYDRCINYIKDNFLS